MSQLLAPMLAQELPRVLAQALPQLLCLDCGCSTYTSCALTLAHLPHVLSPLGLVLLSRHGICRSLGSCSLRCEFLCREPLCAAASGCSCLLTPFIQRESCAVICVASSSTARSLPGRTIDVLSRVSQQLLERGVSTVLRRVRTGVAFHCFDSN